MQNQQQKVNSGQEAGRCQPHQCYKNTYVRWVCSGRNAHGVGSCSNATVVDEEELYDALQAYFAEMLKHKKNVIQYVVREFERTYKAKSENAQYEKELRDKLSKLDRTRQKYMDMYTPTTSSPARS